MGFPGNPQLSTYTDLTHGQDPSAVGHAGQAPRPASAGRFRGDLFRAPPDRRGPPGAAPAGRGQPVADRPRGGPGDLLDPQLRQPDQGDDPRDPAPLPDPAPDQPVDPGHQPRGPGGR